MLISLTVKSKIALDPAFREWTYPLTYIFVVFSHKPVINPSKKKWSTYWTVQDKKLS